MIRDPFVYGAGHVVDRVFDAQPTRFSPCSPRMNGGPFAPTKWKNSNSYLAYIH